jgi:Ran GTPase-activating protein (RanGAP) involved in mRNA processing and transport
MDRGLKKFAEVVKVNAKMAEIDLSANNFGNEGAKHLGEALQENATLKRLHLRKNSIGDDGAVALAEGLQTNQSLISIDLTHNRIHEKGAAALAVCIMSVKILLSENLFSQLPESVLVDSKNKIAKKCKKAVTNLIKGLNVDLDLKDCGLHEHDAEFLVDILTGDCGTKLRTLNLSTNSIGDRGVQLFTEFLTKHTNLKRLDLSGNGMHDETAFELADVLGMKECVIEDLMLSENHFGDAGCIALANSLAVNKTVCVLSLAANKIGDQGVKKIVKAFEVRGSKLHVIDLSNNQIGGSGLASVYFSPRREVATKTEPMIHVQLNGNPVGPVVMGLLEKKKNASTKHVRKVLEGREAKLCLSGKELKDEDLIFVCSVIRAARPRVTSVDLSRNDFGARGITALVQEMKNDRDVTTLDVSHCKLDEEVMKLLIGLLRENAFISKVIGSGNASRSFHQHPRMVY